MPNKNQKRDQRGRFAKTESRSSKEFATKALARYNARQEFLKRGLRGHKIGEHLVSESAKKHIAGGGRTFGDPIVRVFKDGNAVILHGRNRIAVARDQGKKTINAEVESRAASGRTRWRYRGPVKI